MIKKARKKPVEIEFIQFIDKDSVMDILFWAKSKVKYKTTKNYIIINTLEGEMTANVGDYIVRGVNGEFYPVKPDVFKKTYDILENNKYKENDISEIKEKAKAFDEILDINIDKDELLSEEYVEKVNNVIQEWIFS